MVERPDWWNTRPPRWMAALGAYLGVERDKRAQWVSAIRQARRERELIDLAARAMCKVEPHEPSGWQLVSYRSRRRWRQRAAGELRTFDRMTRLAAHE